MPSPPALREYLSQSFAPEERTLPVILSRQADLYGDKQLVSAGETRWSYVQTRDAAARFAATLQNAGIMRGDRVAIICSNRIEFIEVLLGCAWLGAVAVPVNTASRGAQLQHILSNCGARLLVLESTLAGNLGMLDPAALGVEAIWLVDGDVRNGVAFGAVRAVAMPRGSDSIAPADVRPDDLMMILYTSGTTGPSKGVRCPYAQYFWWGANTAALLQLTPDDMMCTTLPLFHTNAINTFYQALVVGAAVHYEKRFSASAFYPALTERKATVTYLLGAMVPILLSRPEGPEESAHNVRISLAPGVPAQFHAEFTRRSGIRLLDGWGSTESNFAIGTGIADQKPGLMGPVFDGFDARIVDEHGAGMPDGTAGELLVRSDEALAFAPGYFNAPEKTAEAWRDGWFHTGDRVIREPDGYYRFVDRLKDAIRRRGENISAFEVEQVLQSHKAVAIAAVFPVRSSLAEDEVMTAIVLHPEQMVTAAELIAFCEPRLPYFAVPRYIDFVSDLPSTENGKVQKFKLRERGITATAWDREVSGEKRVKPKP